MLPHKLRRAKRMTSEDWMPHEILEFVDEGRRLGVLSVLERLVNRIDTGQLTASVATSMGVVFEPEALDLSFEQVFDRESATRLGFSLGCVQATRAIGLRQASLGFEISKEDCRKISEELAENSYCYEHFDQAERARYFGERTITALPSNDGLELPQELIESYRIHKPANIPFWEIQRKAREFLEEADHSLALQDAVRGLIESDLANEAHFLVLLCDSHSVGDWPRVLEAMIDRLGR